MHIIRPLSNQVRSARSSLFRPLLILVFALLINGCGSSLQVKKVKNNPASGVVYALPFTQYDIEIKRRIASCEGAEMKVATDITMTPTSKTDIEHVYAIDVTSLSRFANHASTSVELFEDTLQLKSINAEVKDKSLEIVAGTVKSLATLMTVPSPFGVAPGVPQITCYKTPAGVEVIKNQVTAANAQHTVVKDLTKELSEKTLLATQLASQIADLAPGKDPNLEQSFANAKKVVKAKQAQLELEEKKLAQLLKPISHTQKVQWPLRSDEVKTATPFRIPLPILKKWVSPTISEGDSQQVAMDVYFQIERIDTYGVDPTTIGTEKPPVVTSSLQYRTPALGRLVACNKPACDSNANKANMIAQLEGPIAQLGFVNSLPIKTKTFESAKFSAEWTKNGYLLKAGYEKTQSAGESINAFADAIATQYKDLSDAKASEEQKALDAELLRLQALVGIAEAEKKLQPPEPESDQAKAVEALNADTSLLKAKIERLEAEKKLKELEGS
ncbi:MAG: hypothetical protein R3F50_17530 [Gammaproteobacteria bacterium]